MIALALCALVGLLALYALAVGCALWIERQED